MITFMYRWKIPDEEREQFVTDWTELTKIAKSTFGAQQVNLYKTITGDFVAIATWPSEEAWQMWKKQLADHPLRTRYRQYRFSGPELLHHIVTV